MITRLHCYMITQEWNINFKKSHILIRREVEYESSTYERI